MPQSSETETTPAWDSCPESILALFERWRADGDRRARDEIFLLHFSMARGLARRYQSPHEPIEDLVQVAGLGLLAAMDRFDAARGTSFRAFAVPTILGELRRHFRDTGWAAHVPRAAQELALRIDATSRELSARMHHAPTVTEIAEYLGLATEEVLIGWSAATAQRSCSLDAPVGADAVVLGDTVGALDDRFALVETRLALSRGMRRLPIPERHALALRLQRGLKQSEIATSLGCSQMQVSRLLRNAVRLLREQDAL